MPYKFDAKKGVYRDHDKKAVLLDDLLMVVDDEVSVPPPPPPTDSPRDGQGESIDEWKETMAAAVLALYVRLYVLGRGGLRQMEDADWDVIGQQVTRQGRYLDGFAQDLKDGKLTEAQALARAALYFVGARAAFEIGRAVAMERAGKKQERWVITPGENCTGCIDNAALGWVTLGTLPTPGAGATPCLGNCRCHKIYK